MTLDRRKLFAGFFSTAAAAALSRFEFLKPPTLTYMGLPWSWSRTVPQGRTYFVSDPWLKAFNAMVDSMDQPDVAWAPADVVEWYEKAAGR